MSSVRCPHCGLVSFAADTCKGCGQSFWGGAPGYAPPPPPATDGYAPYAPYATYAAAAAGDNKGLALASFVVALVSFFTLCFLIGVPGAVVAIILGVCALRRIKRDPGRYGGHGFAVAGIVISSVALVFVLPIVAAIAIPTLLASRRAANEAAAVSTMRKLHAAEATYFSTAGDGGYGTLKQLADNELIPRELTTGEQNGYRFQVVAAGEHFALTARPEDYPMSGKRSFYICEDGVIRAADKRGLAAGADDPPMQVSYSGQQTYTYEQ